MSWYCDIAPDHPVHGPYHDREYGFPLDDERGLFERLSLEIFQAGLIFANFAKDSAAFQQMFFSLSGRSELSEAIFIPGAESKSRVISSKGSSRGINTVSML